MDTQDSGTLVHVFAILISYRLPTTGWKKVEWGLLQVRLHAWNTNHRTGYIIRINY